MTLWNVTCDMELQMHEEYIPSSKSSSAWSTSCMTRARWSTMRDTGSCEDVRMADKT